jgi:iron complex transport system substrate-binding protein
MVSLNLRPRWLMPLAAGAAFALAAPATALATTQSGFPVTVTAANGKVTIRSPPTRIVSLSPAATQDLFADGAGKQVVAVDSYSTYPKGAPVTSLNGYSPNVEAIAKYRPDLVVVYLDNNHIVGQLDKLHIPVLVEPAAATLKAAYAQIDQLGQATGHASAAAQVVATMQSQVSAIVRSVPKPKKPLSVYLETGTDPHYSATSDTFLGQILTLLGLRNIADKAGGTYPTLSSEYIVASNPDLIVLTDTAGNGGQTPAMVATRPGWKSIAAVKTGAVVSVNDSIASQWGPRIVVFIQDVANDVKKLEGAAK